MAESLQLNSLQHICWVHACNLWKIHLFCRCFPVISLLCIVFPGNYLVMHFQFALQYFEIFTYQWSINTSLKPLQRTTKWEKLHLLKDGPSTPTCHAILLQKKKKKGLQKIDKTAQIKNDTIIKFLVAIWKQLLLLIPNNQDFSSTISLLNILSIFVLFALSHKVF